MLSHTRTRIKKDVMNSVMLMMIMENQSMVIIIIIRLKNKSLTESLLFLQARKKMNSVITEYCLDIWNRESKQQQQQ